MIKVKKNINKFLYSLITAIIMMTPIYICFFRDLFSINSSVTTIIIMSVLIILFFLCVFLFRQFSISICVALYFCSIILLFLFSLKTNNFYDFSILQFGFYFIFPTLIGMQDMNLKKILDYIIYLSIPIVFGLSSMLSITNLGLNQFDMYTSYAFLVPILVSITHFLFFRKNNNFWIKVGYILNFYYLINVIAGAIRGFWLCMVVFVFFILLSYLKLKQSKSIYYIILYIGVIISVILLFEFAEIITLVIEFTENVLDLKIGFFIKIQSLVRAGDLSNGRNNIYNVIIEYIIQKPVWGYGMNSSPYITSGAIQYPHNYILQLLLDGGLFFAIIPIAISILCVFKILFGNLKREKLIFLIFLVSVTLPQAFLSGNIWQSANFWFMLSWAISNFWTVRKLKY